MDFRFRPAGRLAYFFADDGSGVATFCEQSGDTHFVHVDPVGFRELLSRGAFGLDDLLEVLTLDDQSEADQFAGHLVTLGIIDEIG